MGNHRARRVTHFATQGLRACLRAQLANIVGVHREDGDSRSADRRPADNQRSDPVEVILPCVLARIEEAGHLTGFGINSGQVRALVQIAVVAGECEVRWIVAAAVLPCDDVLDMEGDERHVRLRETAVLTAVRSPAADQPSDGRIHYAAGCPARSLRALA